MDAAPPLALTFDPAAAVAEMKRRLRVYADAEIPEAPRRRAFIADADQIAEGEDRTAWSDPHGKAAPWPERVRLFRLALAKLAAGERAKLRHCLILAIQEQLDPLKVRASNAPRPGTEAAGVLADARHETPGARRRPSDGGGGGLMRVQAEPPPGPDPAAAEALRQAEEAVDAWLESNPMDAEVMRKEEERVMAGSPASPAFKARAVEQRVRQRVLNRIGDAAAVQVEEATA